MSDKLWGVWERGIGWHSDCDGDPMFSGNRDDIVGLRAEMLRVKPERDLTVLAKLWPDCNKAVLWGLCYNADDGTPTWVLDHRGVPIFSEHRRLVLAHGAAMGRPGQPPRPWFAAQIGPRGHPR